MSVRSGGKGKIKPPKRQEQSSIEGWESLCKALQSLVKGESENINFYDNYRIAYNIVLHNNGDKLYINLKELLNQHLEEVFSSQVISALSISNTNNPQPNFANMISLKVLKCVWEHYKKVLDLIGPILMYLDRVYCKSAKVPTVHELGKELFRDIIFQPIKYFILDTILRQIFLEREGEIIDRSIIKAIMDMLLELTGTSTKDSVYDTDFEGLFLEKSSEYYRIEGQRLVEECDAQGYIKNVEERLEEEQQRVKNYLSSVTEPKIRNIVEKELISMQLKTVIEMKNSGLIHMLKNEKIDDLRRMYLLLERVTNGHEEMKYIISNYIYDFDKVVNKTGAKDNIADTTFQEARDFKNKLDKSLNLAFFNDKMFQTAFNEAFKFLSNKDIN
ncbi:Cullin-domain-containing protein [Gigaspora margarita]|uniref:Cullin-domain-containing protein n=1 Tax=Gigaspora margarita TaxID=4874 RepID=A0A8H4AQX3_GIGMA|nr:Cullin-domain-containing protein [Gigaspora margarita]